MAWTTPRTWNAGETVTSTLMNTYVRDNQNALRSAEYNSITAAGNVGTGEDTLHTYSVPANTLAVDGQCLHWQTHISLGANSNSKTIKAYFGSTSITVYSSTGNGLEFVVDFWVWRTGAATQRLLARYVHSSAACDAFTTTASETLSGAVTMKFTGEATSDNDIVQRASTLKFLG
jgi:hypothetical protein